MKIVTIIGARPQFIKAAVVSRALLKKEEVQEVIVHTGQHYDANMSEIFFQELGIPDPHYNLDINAMPNALMTARMIEKIHNVIEIERPDWVLVYGDTNSTLAGAIAAKQNLVKLAHVEAGLRSFNMLMAEECNRVMTDRISDALFCPTDKSMSNLRNEGFEHLKCKMILSGDVMYDAALYYSALAKGKSQILKKLKLEKEYVLVTLHRSENVDTVDMLDALVNALNEISLQIPVVMPLHPRTKKRMEEFNLKLNFDTIEPVGYLDMIQLLQNSSLVMTDSGGLQKEAFFFQKQCVTLRDRTEWTELIQNGFAVIAGADPTTILKGFNAMMNKKSDFSNKLYGNGNAGTIIADFLVQA